MLKNVTFGLLATAFLSAPALGQILPPPEALPEPKPPAASPNSNDEADERPECEDGFEVIIIPKGNGDPIYKCQQINEIFGQGGGAGLTSKPDDKKSADADASADASNGVKNAPDYSKLSPSAERTAKLNDMFDRLAEAPDAESGNLVAEEIWAVWLESGSASINLVLRRGSDAQKKDKVAKARQLYDHVTTLSPDYAEGWARSARLALEEKDLSRALTESAQALILEPRHFYALWTMGNVFEQLGRTEDALEAYREANKLYPELKAVKDRKEALEQQVDGAVL